MLKPDQAGDVAEHVIIEYIAALGCANDGDIANGLEMLLSKTARALEKTVGANQAGFVCERTGSRIKSCPMTGKVQH